MTSSDTNSLPQNTSRPMVEHGQTTRGVQRCFTLAIWLVLLGAVLGVIYWGKLASDRYVSEASVIIRKTDSAIAPSPDLSMLIAGVSGVNRADQLLLREYLLSMDMLKKLDAALGLRAHYSSREHDLLSRLWLTDLEWFHRHYLSRTSISYDDFAGVLRIRVQAYSPDIALAIAQMLVHEGEVYMNHISHEMTEIQVNFLTTQVDVAQERFQEASKTLLAFQNEKGLLSPQATAESANVLIAKLEEQKAQTQTQLAALPKTLGANHPTVIMLRQSLAALEQQISTEKAKLANPTGKTLNITMEEFHRLQMEVNFTQELYKAALTALEKGRIDAARLLEKVSVLQAPTLPEYPMQPRRIYNSVVTMAFALILAGILKLLEGIIRDHVD